jgi:hypothetical protein
MAGDLREGVGAPLQDQAPIRIAAIGVGVAGDGLGNNPIAFLACAGLELPWSTGPVEGHIKRLKHLKRQMFGAHRWRCCANGSNSVLRRVDQIIKTGHEPSIAWP